MNELTVPPSPNWYGSSMLKCAPDNTLLYGSRNALVVIAASDREVTDVRVLTSSAHTGRVSAVAINAKWGDPNKYCVTACDEGTVKLWDVAKYKVVSSHKTHASVVDDKKVISVSIVGDRVVGVSQGGHVTVWHIGTDAVTSLPNLFNMKVKVACMSSCPHVAWLTAFGLDSGLVVLADLRKNGRILCKLRRHTKEIIDLAWCPSPYTVFATKPKVKTEIIYTNYGSAQHKDSSPAKTEDPEDSVKENIGPNNLDEPKTLDESSKQQNDVAAVTVTDKPKIIVTAVNDDNTESQIDPIDQDNELSASDAETKAAEDKSDEPIVSESTFDEKAEQETVVDSVKQKVFLLASVCRKGMICIWNGGTDGILQAFIDTKVKPKHASQKKRENWFCLCWATPDTIFSSSEGNHVVAWHLSSQKRHIPKNKTDKHSFLYTVLHSEHKKLIFSMAVPLKLYPEPEDYGTGDREALHVWTISQDRWILCCNLEGVVLNSYPTLSGFVNCMGVSPIDPNRLAIGVGDNSLRIWNLSLPHTNKIPMSIFWDKVKSKITTLDWNPTLENVVAYGTDEGRIGVIDVSNLSKPAVIYSNYHRSVVFKVQWGPVSGGNTFGLYSCANGKFIMHRPEHPEEFAVEVVIPGYNVANFSWKPDYSQVAIGMREGIVKIISRDSVPLQTLYMQTKCVQCIAWHPESTAMDSGKSPLCDYLAVATTDLDIYVYDTSVLQKDDECTAAAKSNVVDVLRGHSLTVKSLSWCPHVSGRLVSASEDCTAQVWDLKTKSLIATYQSADPLISVHWSPLDADLIIISARNNILKIWRVTKNPPVLNIDRKLRKKPKIKAVVEIPASDDQALNVKRKTVLSATANLQKDVSYVTLPICWKLLEQSDDANKQDAIDVANGDSEDAREAPDEDEKKDSPFDCSKLYGTRRNVAELLDFEQSAHLAKKDWSAVHHIELWKGNLGASIRDAMADGVINEMMVSLAPMVSYQLWLEACEMYAEKLLENEKGLEASACFLACHKVPEAIAALCKVKFFRDALALAQMRLPARDPVTTDVLQQWADHCVYCGNYEMAAQILVKLGKLNEASELLNKRSDLGCLELAAELAKRCQNNELLAMVQVKLDLQKRAAREAEGTAGIFPSRLEAMMEKGPQEFQNCFATEQ